MKSSQRLLPPPTAFAKTVLAPSRLLSLRCWRCWFVLALLTPSYGHAEEDGARPQTTVGMVGRFEEVKIPGSELEVIPLEDRDTPLVVRIVRTFPHGTDFRYEIEYYGLEPGEYDLRDYLRRIDGSDTEAVPRLAVTVAPVLPPGQVRPNELVAGKPPRLGGYKRLLITLAVVWVVGLALIIGLWRKSKAASDPADARPKTLAERLRPLVDRALAGDATQAELASLERSLLTYWRKRLNLHSMSASAAIRELRNHPDAGGLMTQLESWLHRPEEQPDLDIEALLSPYRDVPEDDFEMDGAPTTSASSR